MPSSPTEPPASRRPRGATMAAAPASTHASRERMLEATVDLLRGWGLSGAGINDIVRESGAPKGSVYHFFPGGKTQIAREALSIYAERVRGLLAETLGGAATPADKVHALFDAFARRVAQAGYRRSCAVGTVGLDLGDDVEAVREVLAAALTDWQAEVARHFDLGSPARTQAFAGVVVTAIEGAYVRCRVERSPQAFREAGDWLAKLVA